MEPITLSSLLLISFFITCAYYYIYRTYTYWHRLGIPSVKPRIPFGNLKNTGHYDHFCLILDPIYKKLKKLGSIGGVYIYHKPFAMAINEEAIKNILIKDFNYFEDRCVYYNEKDDPISAHIFAIDAHKWHRLRSKVSATFSSGKMKLMYSTVLRISKEFEAALAKSVDSRHSCGSDLDVRDIAARFSVDVIGTCAFGIECNSLTNPNDEFKKNGQKAFGQRKVPYALTLIYASYPKLARKFRLKAFADEVGEFYTKIVHESVQYRETNDVGRNDFMDLMMNFKKTDALTMNEIVAQCFVFFVAGFDTSSLLITYSLYELARKPHLQEKLRNEIKSVLDKQIDGDFSYEAIMNIPYLDQVLNETLRMHPPVPTLFRRVSKDYRIPGTETILPKGLGVFIPVYSIHHDPDIFPNPEEFRPERFSFDPMSSPSLTKNMNFLAFGQGPRSCLGLRFGKMQSSIGLATVLLNYNVSICDRTCKKIEYSKTSVIFQPNDGIWLNFKKI